MSVWSRSAVWILDHPRPIWTTIGLVTVILGLATTRLQTEHAAGSFVSDEEEFVRDFHETGRVFGRSEAILYVVLHETDPLDPVFLRGLDSLSQHVASRHGVESVLSLTNVPHLERSGAELVTSIIYDPSLSSDDLRARFTDKPFLDGLLVSEDGLATVMMVRINPEFNDTPARVALVDEIEAAAESMPGDASLAGFPYLRSQYAKRVTFETPAFTVLALIISLLFLFLTFRSWRTVVLPTVIVGLAIVWTFGLMAISGVKLNIVTAILPALIVIIGMATAIHLTTKFFDQYALLQDRRQALLDTLRTVGLATFLACLTTAIGFAVLLISGNNLLIGFGGFAAIGILLLYGLSITMIPLAYVRFPAPRANVVVLATHDRFSDYFDAKARFIQRHAGAILVVSGLIVAVSIVGAMRISTDIFVFSDFYEDDPLRRNLAVFEEKFSGVLPMEVVVKSEREGRFKTLGAMRRVEQLQERLGSLEPVGTTLSAVDLIKMGNQAYFGGHPAAYRLPSSYELPFLQNALGRFIGVDPEGELFSKLPLFVDSTFGMTRIYLGVTDIGTERMNELADTVAALTRSTFAEDEFEVLVTGTAIMSTRSGESLVRNLIISLSVALVLISILMALLFRSRALTFISLIPNVIPLLIVGGAMGFAGITLKPSTALIFSLAFGIAVDDTIHFLAKYRIHRTSGLPRDASIQKTMGETGKAILFTSLILMSGFLVFTLSSFGGTVNLGALTALTLGVALIANLFLLPALLFTFGPEGHFSKRPIVPHASTSPSRMG